MKKGIFAIMVLLLSINLCAQQEVTKFLGIPVDGSRTEMIRKLKEKGFEQSWIESDILEGEFNGRNVYVGITTNNNKVWRIGLADKDHVSKTNIKIRFNELCQQFENNKKYIPTLPSADYTIPDHEDIAYEMAVHDKRYEAGFYQIPTELDSIALINEVLPMLQEKYPQDDSQPPTEEIQKEIQETIISYLLEQWSKRIVWFMISKSPDGYYINMYYDNMCNRANGEDL